MKSMIKTLQAFVLLFVAFAGSAFVSISHDDLMGAMKKMMDKMHKMEMTNNFDKNFSVMMAEHHQGAIDMADILLKSGKDDKLKAMAQKSSAKQKEEQKTLRDIGEQLKGDKGDGSERNELMTAMHSMMSEMDKMKMTGDVDKDFANMMVMHHKSGVEMGKAEISHGKNTKLKQMAQKMIEDQEKEIGELKNWLAGK